jgi:ABC-type uncharacterized transport system substrate-binding protein
MMRIRSAVLAVCGAVVLAACGGAQGGGAGQQGGGSGFTPSTSGPIQVGVLITDIRAEAQRNGISVINPYREAAHAMVDSINAKGGVEGRKLQVVDDAIDFSAPNHDSAFEAICQRYTKDNQVQAVVYDGTIYNQAFNKCLTTAGVPILYMGVTGSPVGDETDFKDNPGLVAVNAVSLDRRVKSIMNKGVAAGFLPSGSRIGVVIEKCPHNERAYENTLKPLADKGGIELVRAEINCSHGYSDTGPALAQVQSFALKLKSENVDSVMFMTLYENGLIYYFAQSAQAQKWAPQYLLFRAQAHPDLIKLYAADQLIKMRGFGGFPDGDVTKQPAPSAEQAKVRDTCLAAARGKGMAARTLTEQVTVFQTCDAMRLLQEGLVNSGGLGGTEKLVPAIEKIGTEFVSAVTLDGATKFGPGRHDGMELTAVSTFDAGCKCFSYTTKPEPIG